MRHRNAIALVTLALVPLLAEACATENSSAARSTPVTADPDAGAESSVRTPPVKEAGASTPWAEADIAPEASYAVCPAVFDGPVPPMNGQPRTDSGALGLRELRARVEKSREAFRRYTQAHGGNYSYERQRDSVFGSFCETKIVVEGGVVKSRSEGAGEPGSAWTETGAAIGSHNPGCHPALTAEALYDECLTTVLCQDPRENYITVHVDSRGLLAECEYFPINCQDDCYSGIEPIAITTDGVDWTDVEPKCCPISAHPDCCMDFGGTRATRACGTECDGMASPIDPSWEIVYDATGCPMWNTRGSGANCCGCASVDAGASRDAGGQ